MLLTAGIHLLPLSANLMGEQRTIHLTLLRDGDATVLVDAAYPGQLPLFKDALSAEGIAFDSLRRIIITHQDLDHIGSLPAILGESPHPIEVLAHELERPYIQGERKLVKNTAEAQARLDDLPEPWRSALKRVLDHPPTATVDRTIAHGEQLPIAGGLVVVGTPGHTPGHISLYHRPSRTLIAADALTVEDGRLLGPAPDQTHDMTLALRSLEALAEYDIDTVVCYHGGIYHGSSHSIRQRIAEIARGD